MPASTRRRASLLALGFLSVLLLPGAARSAPGQVTIGVASGGSTSPAFRIEVRNDTAAAVETTVRQDLPRGATVKAVSAGGRAAPASAGGRAAGGEVTWQLHLPAGGRATLRTTLAPPAAVPLAVPACAFTGTGTVPYDCATALWGIPGGPGAPTPWWQRPAVLAGGLAGLLLVLVVAGWWWWRRRRLRRGGLASRERAQSAIDAAGQRPPPLRAAQPAAPTQARQAPPTWRVVSLAFLMLVGMVAGVVWLGGSQVTAFGPNAQSTSGAWVGSTKVGTIGTTLREAAFEFTVYRLACTPTGQSSQQCLVTVGLRNVSGTSQQWHAGMQRAYLPSGGWVTADAAASRAANGDRDVFAYPIPAGGRLLCPLAFIIEGDAAPTRFELRSGVFSAGVSIVP